MMPPEGLTANMDVDEAMTAVVTRLRGNPDVYRSHGYDVYLPKLWEDYVAERAGMPLHAYRREAAAAGPEVSPFFYAAGWELCRRGILRPGVRSVREQVTPQGQGGDGYSCTPTGRRWNGSFPSI